ncbi:hypothetical protein [Desulfosarcina ovata]|uniref:Uncharacterized protein n=1 Tax=Desulfosarcina ovata subsp. ovata TaxID=2752305 RepID=A0A5K8AEQ7_9BACT|nr:hypothetical protein [Desulfosarcina ovata]BBO91006.1 hypothetical protein DSCOOX_41860 [Desulfosarcina ovata subsp. ovata]
MATELFPSSFRCDCGEELDFSEGTIHEMKKMSKNKHVRLGEGKHTIIFHKGEAKEILCPKLKKCAITSFE